MNRKDPIQLFFKHVDKTTDCWLWIGARGGLLIRQIWVQIPGGRPNIRSLSEAKMRA